ncbi:MarR family winged helix-turn-helix transcriptional regulator [Candidatus Thiodiazotropha sp. CDECU1]|uniref:MarR family winged helix-turn-helix transcriptional regulator n=1 Tax=Candidatus Thiodiazotropha sp. CDECU1 TaxID=3065865 RepID=UPI0029307746|nr:MarR family transcriptional regulator [Candidatus Thiodiazotropha sp. CDECU1]
MPIDCQPSDDSVDFIELDELQNQADTPLGVAYMVGRLDRALRRSFRKALDPMGLTIGQYTALSVFCSSGKLSNAKLAERTMVSPQAANELIKGMEKNGWIIRKPDPNHGRIIHISLTSEGKRLLARCNQVISQLERQMLHGLNDKEIKALHGKLRNAVGILRDL